MDEQSITRSSVASVHRAQDAWGCIRPIRLLHFWMRKLKTENEAVEWIGKSGTWNHQNRWLLTWECSPTNVCLGQKNDFYSRHMLPWSPKENRCLSRSRWAAHQKRCQCSLLLLSPTSSAGLEGSSLPLVPWVISFPLSSLLHLQGKKSTWHNVTITYQLVTSNQPSPAPIWKSLQCVGT